MANVHDWEPGIRGHAHGMRFALATHKDPLLYCTQPFCVPEHSRRQLRRHKRTPRHPHSEHTFPLPPLLPLC
eukprot:gene15533-biopygen23196